MGGRLFVYGGGGYAGRRAGTAHLSRRTAGARAAYPERSRSATALPRSRWWKDILILGRLRVRGDRQRVGQRRTGRSTARSVGRARHSARCRTCSRCRPRVSSGSDRPDGVWAKLGRPARVLVDPSSGQDADSLTVVALGDAPPRTDPKERDPSLRVALDDRCFWWSDASATCRCHERKPVEFNPFNDFGQQQGLACCFPKAELAAMGQGTVASFIRQPRRQCPKWTQANAKCTLTTGSAPPKARERKGPAAQRSFSSIPKQHRLVACLVAWCSHHLGSSRSPAKPARTLPTGSARRSACHGRQLGEARSGGCDRSDDPSSPPGPT